MINPNMTHTQKLAKLRQGLTKKVEEQACRGDELCASLIVLHRMDQLVFLKRKQTMTLMILI